MDDGMLGDAMTLKELGSELRGLRQELRQEVAGLRSEIAAGREDTRALALKVDTGFENTRALAAKVDVGLEETRALASKVTIGFEETHALLKFGLEAREAPRESMETRFEEADRKHDEQITLLKDVLRESRHPR